jgi:hypothetical protein
MMANAPGEKPDRGRAIALVLLYLAIGTGAAVIAVEIVQALGLDPTGQRVVAFACVGTALLLLAGNSRVKAGEPVAVIATLLGICTAAVAALGYIGPIEAEPPLGCINSSGEIDATVSGETTVVFSRATPASEPKRLLLRGCQLKAEGYCVGAVHQDALENQVLDSRWLILSDNQGLVPAGRTVGNTPAHAHKRCAGDVPRPDHLTFTAAELDRAKATVALQAVAPRAAFVGFALEHPDGRWVRLGWDKTPEDDQPLNAPAPAEAVRGAEVAAVACIAFRRSSGPVRRATLGRGRTDRTDLPVVKQPIWSRPEQAACDAAVPPPGQ